MTTREAARVLEGRIEIDDAYLGGEHPGKRGRGSPDKVPFIAAVQTTQEGKPVLARFARFARLPFTREALETWARRTLPSSARVLSDGLGCFRGVTAGGATYTSTVMNGARAGRPRSTRNSAP